MFASPRCKLIVPWSGIARSADVMPDRTGRYRRLEPPRSIPVVGTSFPPDAEWTAANVANCIAPPRFDAQTVRAHAESRSGTGARHVARC